MMYRSWDERDRLGDVLLANIRQRLADLTALLQSVAGERVYEDVVYRFYHQSLKVYEKSQWATREIVAALTDIAPEGLPLCPEFQEIVRRGLEREFRMEDNEDWINRALPPLHAFLHALYFLEMAVKYGPQFEKVPSMMPSGLAALLCLYEIR